MMRKRTSGGTAHWSTGTERKEKGFPVLSSAVPAARLQRKGCALIWQSTGDLLRDQRSDAHHARSGHRCEEQTRQTRRPREKIRLLLPLEPVLHHPFAPLECFGGISLHYDCLYSMRVAF